MIGIDWGTTNFRAYRFDGGRVVARMETGPGLLHVSDGGFAAALRQAVGPWLAEGERHILLCGMVGSRQGWVEAPYLPCPADLASLAAAAQSVAFDGATVRILPGLCADRAVPEVMRGEEVQILGALATTGPDATICLPGSHSKWVQVVSNQVTAFHTHMTGEAFAALRGHTILGRLMQDGPHAPGAFREGLVRAGEPGGLLHHLFGVRTLGLFGRMPAEQAPSYLSGLLIGHEILSAAPVGPVFLVGTPALSALYADAIHAAGHAAVIVPHDAAAAGLATIGEHVAWD